MIDPDIYMNANAATVAEGSIQMALWHGIEPGAHVERSIAHAKEYGIPSIEFRARIWTWLGPALAGEKGLIRLLRHNMWRCPNAHSLREYLELDWETELTPAQILERLK